MICPIHNIEFVQRKGISSKTNKPYDFMACPEKNKDGNFCNGGKQSRDEVVSRLLVSMNEKLDSTLTRLDNMAEYLKAKESMYVETKVATKEELKNVPF